MFLDLTTPSDTNEPQPIPSTRRAVPSPLVSGFRSSTPNNPALRLLVLPHPAPLAWPRAERPLQLTPSRRRKEGLKGWC